METKTGTASIRLYNDTKHSQKEVFMMLMKLLGHEPAQALQCIGLIERHGSYTVREDMESIIAIDMVGAMRLAGFKVELEFN
jgi:hypothetical protein